MCCWMITEAWLVGLPQGELQWGGVSAAECRDLHLRPSCPHLLGLHVGSSFQRKMSRNRQKGKGRLLGAAVGGGITPKVPRYLVTCGVDEHSAAPMLSQS